MIEAGKHFIKLADLEFSKNLRVFIEATGDHVKPIDVSGVRLTKEELKLLIDCLQNCLDSGTF